MLSFILKNIYAKWERWLNVKQVSNDLKVSTEKWCLNKKRYIYVLVWLFAWPHGKMKSKGY